ncbi:hypothetical protein K488DRAFT_46862 [Vararia minispora EC-137]|uniref:Uncharacterized protein n=1 Tax=Vararia minispora EC-137 TaxID=1314806 RepID=A0ACB8QQY3_9AGAM|nr:hypothetical protein K488DRAFT_46862 [Vararia minispora EC-137]
MSRYDVHVRRAHPITFGLILLFAVILLGLTAFLVSVFNSARLNFLLFCSVWTLVFAPIFLAFFYTAPGHLFASVGSHWVFLFLTWVFWLAGAAALSDILDGPFSSGSCSRFSIPHCSTLRATEAFAWIEWILLTWAFFAVTFLGVHHIRGGRGYRGPMYDV